MSATSEQVSESLMGLPRSKTSILSNCFDTQEGISPTIIKTIANTHLIHAGSNIGLNVFWEIYCKDVETQMEENSKQSCKGKYFYISIKAPSGVKLSQSLENISGGEPGFIHIGIINQPNASIIQLLEIKNNFSALSLVHM